MISDSKSLSLMGLPNSEMYLFEKDSKSVECNLVQLKDITTLRDSDQILVPKQQHQHQHQQPQQQEKCNKVLKASNSLEIKLPGNHADKEFNKLINEDDDRVNYVCEDGLKTPTSTEQRISVLVNCPPPAPRKSKSPPSTKRKFLHQEILLDLSDEVESLFPPAIRADLRGKIKKVKQYCDSCN